MRRGRLLTNTFLLGLMMLLFPLGSKAQSGGSLLVRTVQSDLVIHGEVVAVSDVTQWCIPLKCQTVALKIIEVLKGEYDAKYINVEFYIGNFGRYVAKNNGHPELSPYMFGKGKQWILALDTKNEFRGEILGLQMQPYQKYVCLQGSLESITPASHEEIEAFKALIKATALHSKAFSATDVVGVRPGAIFAICRKNTPSRSRRVGKVSDG